MKNLRYLILSTGLSMLLIFTALPYYCISSVAIPGLEIYLSYDEVYRFFLVFFPVCSFLGAITTLRKRKNVEDVLINVEMPLLVLLFLRVYKYFPIPCIVVLGILGILVLQAIYETEETLSDQNVGKRARHTYYKVRKRMTCLLLFTIGPLGIWVSSKENADNSRLQAFFQNYTVTEEEELLTAELHYELSSEEEWEENDSLEEKTWQLQCLADDFFGELGVTSVPVYVVTNLEETVLGAYSEVDDAIYINKAFLEKSTISEAVRVVAHECHHRYQHAVIQSIMILEAAEFPYEKLEYYQDAMELVKGFKNYGEDLESYHKYLKNEMEQQAESYAKTKVLELAEQYDWKNVEEADR